MAHPISLDEERVADLAAYYGTHSGLAHQEGTSPAFRPTNLYHFKDFMFAPIKKKSLDPALPFFDAGFGDGRVLAAASLVFGRVLGLEADEGLAEQGLAHLDRLAGLGLIDRGKIRAVAGDFLCPDDYERKLKAETHSIRQFYNYYDNAADLLDFLVRHGHPRAKLLLYTSKVLVPGHDGFAATQIWEGDGFVAVVYERRASSPLKSSINNPWLC